jgi:NitT/TauT family transport system ATP-binding protein
MEMKSAITIKNMTKAFGQFVVIDNFSLDIEEGTITSILAPSGAGKTTLLRVVSGLEKPTSGSVTIDSNEVTQPSPEIGFMFQESSAFPWLTVKQNIEFGLKLKANKHKVNGNDIGQAVYRICKELNIDKFLEFYPSQLSGGQKQRVVIARSLILKPKIILCDEPFSALDEITRNDLRELLLELHSHYLPTIVFITHSLEEAVFLGNHVVISSGPPLRCVEIVEIKFSLTRTSHLLDTREFLEAKLRAKNILAKVNNDNV